MLRYLKSLPPPTAKTLYIVGNQSADMDSCCCAIITSFLFKSPDFDSIQPYIDIPRSDLRLRPDIAYLFKHLGISLDTILFKEDLPSNAENRLFLVDHNSPTIKGKVYAIIDHHQPEGEDIATVGPKVIKPVGSCMSLVIDHFRDSVGWDETTATLALAPILQDTRNLTQKDKTTPTDVSSYNFVSKYLPEGTGGIAAFAKNLKNLKKDLDGFSAGDLIKKDYKQWGALGISSMPALFEELLSKWQDLPGAMKRFKAENSLKEFVCLSSGKRNGEYVREFAIVGNDIDIETEGSSLKLKLQQQIDGVYFYDQGVTTANRKVAAPLMRKLVDN